MRHYSSIAFWMIDYILFLSKTGESVLDNNRDILRDPIWQFIGVVVGAVAIFMAYLTLPSSIQGATLVMIVVTTIALLLIFVRNKTTWLLLTCAFPLVSCVWSLIIDGLTYYQMPFFGSDS
jgi:hypothetical protein